MQTISLAQNELHSLEHVAPHLVAHLPKLKRLNLSNNQLSRCTELDHFGSSASPDPRQRRMTFRAPARDKQRQQGEEEEREMAQESLLPLVELMLTGNPLCPAPGDVTQVRLYQRYVPMDVSCDRVSSRA